MTSLGLAEYKDLVKRCLITFKCKPENVTYFDFMLF